MRTHRRRPGWADAGPLPLPTYTPPDVTETLERIDATLAAHAAAREDT